MNVPQSNTSVSLQQNESLPVSPQEKEPEWYNSAGWIKLSDVPKVKKETPTEVEWYNSAGWIKLSDAKVRPMAIEAMKQNPEQASEDLLLAKKYNVSPALVREKREEFLQKSVADGAESTLSASAKTAEWFSKNSHNATLIKDDLDNATGLENILQKQKRDGDFFERTGRALKEGAVGAEIGALGALEALIENAPTAYSPYMPSNFYKEVPRKASADFIKGDIKELYEWLQDSPFTEAEGGMKIWENIVRQAPQTAAFVVTTIASKGANLPALLGGVLAGGNKYASLREEGVSRERALFAALADGTANYGLGKINIGRNLNIFKAKGKQELAHALREAAFNDIVTSLGQTYVDKATMLWGEAPFTGQSTLQKFADNFWEYTKEGLYNGLISLPYTGVLTGGRVAHDLARYRRVLERDVKFFEALDNNASESKLKQRSPEAYQDLVDHLSADAPIENLYISPEAMRSALGDESTLYQTLDDLGISKEEFARSESLGTDVEIPLNLYQGKIAGTERSLALRGDIKTSPDSMTLSEQANFEEQFSKHVEETVNQFKDRLLQDEALNEALAPIEQELTSLYGKEGARSHVDLLRARAVVASDAWTKAGKSMTPAEWITNQVKLRVSTEKTAVNEQPLFQPSKEEISQADIALERDAKAWAESIDTFMQGKLSKRYHVVMLGQTPLVLQMLGAKKRSIKTIPAVLKKVMQEKHHLSADVVKQVPKAMADPIMVFKSDSRKDSLVMMLDIKDANGATVIVPVALEAISNGGYEINFVPSIYGKGGFGKANNKWFVKQVEKGNVLYVNHKKSQEWSRASGLQLPGGVTSPDIIQGQTRSFGFHNPVRPRDKQNIANLEKVAQHQQGMPSKESPIDLSNKNIRTEQDLVKLREENPTLYQGEEGVRGSISFHDNETLIRVFKESADFSTFVHETGHLFIKDMENLLATGSAPEHIAHDLQKLNDFTAEFSDPKKLQDFYESTYRKQRKEFSDREFSSLTEQEKEQVAYVAKQEKLAEAFVTYLHEGKAPSIELRPVFQRFKAWLQKVYQTLSGNIPINDSVREVFDRMLASEQEVTLAEEVHNAHAEEVKALENVASKMLNEREKEQLAKAREQATASSQESRLKKVLQAFSRAGINKKELHAQAIKEVNETPVYAAQDQAIHEGGLHYDTIKEAYGEETAKALQKKCPTLLRKGGTVSLHELAIAHGFASEEALIDAMNKTQGKKADIASRVKEKTLAQEQAIRQELGLDQGINVADEDYFSSQRLESLELEARALTRHTGRKVRTFGTATTLRALARRMLESMPYKEGRNIGRLSSAEAKQSARVAKALAKGDMETAADAKRRQAISHAMVLEAMQARHEADVFTRAFKRYTKSKTMTFEHQEQIRALGEIYKLLPNTKPLRPEERLPFREFVENITAESIYEAPPFSEFLLYERLPENMTLEQRQEVQGAIRWLAEEGRPQEAKLLSDETSGTVGDAVATGVKSIQESGNTYVPKTEGTIKRSVQNAWKNFFSGLDHIQFMLMSADGYTEIGKNSHKKGFHSDLFQRVMNAQSKYFAMFRKARPELERIAKVRDGFVKRFEKTYKGRLVEHINGIKTPEIMQEIGRTHWTAEHIWCLARNMGNAGNIKTLHEGLGLSDAMLQQLTSILNKQEWLAIQSEGELVGRHYEASDAVFRKVYGRPMPDKVDPLPRTVITAEGEALHLEGWYFPLSVDGKLHPEVGDSKSIEVNKAEPSFVAYGASLAKSFTKSRTGTSKAVALSYGVLDSALRDQWRFMTHAPVIRDVDKITRNKEWRKAYTKAFGQDYYDQLRSWLKHTARPVTEKGDVVDSIIDNQRKLSTVFSLGLNTSTFIRQFQGYFQAVPDLGGKWILKGIARASHNPMELVHYIDEQSVFMADRDKNFVRELRKSVVPTNARIKKTIGEKTYTLADVQEVAMAPVVFGDRLTAYPIWQGAYMKATESLGMNHAKAVEFADGIIQKTQASNTEADLNMWQRESGKSWKRLFSMFMSEALRKGSRMRYYGRALKHNKISKGEYASHLLYETVAPALFYAAMRSLMTSTPPDAGDIAEQIFNETGGTLPFVGQIGSALFSGYGNAMDSPAFRGVEMGVNTGKNMLKVLQGKDDAYAALFKSLVDLAAFSAGTGNARRIYETAAEGWEDMQMGETSNPFRLFLKKPK